MQTVEPDSQANPHPPIPWDLADRMRQAARHAGLTGTAIAAQLGVTRNTVSSWLNGRNTPRARDLASFARLTQCTVHWLRTGEEEG